MNQASVHSLPSSSGDAGADKEPTTVPGWFIARTAPIALHSNRSAR